MLCCLCVRCFKTFYFFHYKFTVNRDGTEMKYQSAALNETSLSYPHHQSYIIYLSMHQKPSWAGHGFAKAHIHLDNNKKNHCQCGQEHPECTVAQCQVVLPSTVASLCLKDAAK